jgi:hypothetical protein
MKFLTSRDQLRLHSFLFPPPPSYSSFLSSHLMLQAILSFCILTTNNIGCTILHYATSLKHTWAHWETVHQHISDSASTSSTLLQQQIFLLIYLHTFYTHFMYVTGQRLMNHAVQVKRTYTVRNGNHYH